MSECLLSGLTNKETKCIPLKMGRYEAWTENLQKKKQPTCKALGTTAQDQDKKRIRVVRHFLQSTGVATVQEEKQSFANQKVGA